MERIVVSLILLLFLTGCEGVKVITIDKPIFIEIPVYVEKVIEVERIVEVAFEVVRTVLLTDWESPDELAKFLADDNTDKHFIFRSDSSGSVKFNGQCEDFAMQLRDRAMAKGKYLSVEVIPPGEYAFQFGVWGGSYHAMNMAIIGNEFWLIEPQTDRMWQAYFLD